jgi:F0F1-type ATP synthase membrane subunit b/b'
MKKKVIITTAGLVAIGLIPTVIVATQPPQNDQTREERTQHEVRELNGIRDVNLRLEFAKVLVVTDGGDRLELDTRRWTKGPSSGEVHKWIVGGDLGISRRDHQLLIEDSPLRSQALEVQNHGDDSRGHEEVTVHLPKGLKLDLKVGGGSVDERGSFRSLNSSLGEGEVNAHLDPSLAEDSQIHIGGGKAKVELADGLNVNVHASVGVGLIEGLPAGSRSPNKFGDNRSGQLGKGGADFGIDVGAGEVALVSSQKIQPMALDRTERSGSPEKFSFHMDSDDQDMKEQDLDKIGEDVDRALKQAQPDIDRAMDSVRPQLEDAFAEMGPALKRAMEQVGPAVEKALREAKPEIERAKREHPEEYEREILRVKPEIKRAIKGAMRELKKAQAEMNRKEMRDLDSNGHLKEALREAMRQAREGLRKAFEASHDAVKD